MKKKSAVWAFFNMPTTTKHHCSWQFLHACSKKYQPFEYCVHKEENYYLMLRVQLMCPSPPFHQRCIAAFFAVDVPFPFSWAQNSHSATPQFQVPGHQYFAQKTIPQPPIFCMSILHSENMISKNLIATFSDSGRIPLTGGIATGGKLSTIGCLPFKVGKSRQQQMKDGEILQPQGMAGSSSSCAEVHNPMGIGCIHFSFINKLCK